MELPDGKKSTPISYIHFASEFQAQGLLISLELLLFFLSVGSWDEYLIFLAALGLNRVSFLHEIRCCLLQFSVVSEALMEKATL